MRILVTGAFGNIGKAVIKESYDRGHKVTVFEVENKKTRKDAQRYHNQIEKLQYGDIRNFVDVKNAVKDCDAVIHLAAIIPPTSKNNRKLTMDVNYIGTVNLVNAINELDREIPFVFTSSASVLGSTQSQNKLVDRNDLLVVTGNYEESKIRCEQYLQNSAENYLIFRLAGVLPSFSSLSPLQAFSYIEEVFDMHPDMRLEMITGADVATALVSGVEKLESRDTPMNQAYILGGGEKNGWRFKGDEFVSILFGAFSLPVPDRRYFTQDINTYHLDWYDTEEAQREFNFQNTSFEDFLTDMKNAYGLFRLPIMLLKWIIIDRIEKKSPYYHN